MSRLELYSGWVDSDKNYLKYYKQPTTHTMDFSFSLFGGLSGDLRMTVWEGSGSTWIVELRDFFLDQFLPTNEELMLFELEFGIPYPSQEMLNNLK